MLVRDLMQTRVVTVEVEDGVDRLVFLIHARKIRHLPVVERGQVVGIVSDRDVLKALGRRVNRRTTAARVRDAESDLYVIPRRVRHIMSRGVVTIPPDLPAGEAAALMARRKIGALPVVEGGTLVGILTATDVLLAFSRVMAEPKR